MSISFSDGLNVLLENKSLSREQVRDIFGQLMQGDRRIGAIPLPTLERAGSEQKD